MSDSSRLISAMQMATALTITPRAVRLRMQDVASAPLRGRGGPRGWALGAFPVEWQARFLAAETRADARDTEAPIGDCAFWAKHLAAFAGAVPEVEEFVFEDQDSREPAKTKAIQAFRIRFASGFEITALSSRPRSLRGRQGFVIIDEAAFHDDLAELIKAALALLIWGGRVWIISTHDGADNPFNELVEDCRAGKRPFTVLRTTFDDALAAGLFQRICLVSGKQWSAEAEKKFRDEIYAFYGDAADEELGVIPAAGAGVFLDRALIAACSSDAHKVVYWACKPDFVHKSDGVRRAAAQAWFDDEVRPALAAFPPDGLSFVGADIARSADLTDFAAGYIPRQSPSKKLVVPLVLELRNVPFAEQEWILHELIRALPRFSAGKVDARGVGAQIAERTMQLFGASRIEEVKATVEWYRANMPVLKRRFEDGSIEIPKDDDVRNDLRLFKVTKGVPQLPEGVRIRSSRGGTRHGDSAIALAMLVAAAEQPSAPIEYGSTKQPRVGYGAFSDAGPEAQILDRGGDIGRVRAGVDTTGF